MKPDKKKEKNILQEGILINVFVCVSVCVIH